MEQIFGLNNNIKFINFIITSLNDNHYVQNVLTH